MRRPIATVRPALATFDSRAVLPPPKVADRFYTSPQWRALVASLIRTRGIRCERCGRSGEGGVPIRIFGDHVHELRDGGAPLDPRNIELLCAKCHGRKTIAERVRRLSEPSIEVQA